MVMTSDFPQADRLSRVGQVALAISNGYLADAEIESFLGLDSQGRQGRYYRLAAEVLGLVRNEHNHATLTVLGAEFATLNEATAKMDFLARCVVDTPVFHTALLYIHQYRPTDKQLRLWFRSYYPGAESTADRRFHTFIKYLHDADLIDKYQDKNILKKFTGGVIKQSEIESKLLTHKKLNHPKRARSNTENLGYIRFDIDAQKLERANQVHWRLIEAKSNFLSERNFEPYANQSIDLYAKAVNDFVLYEMKSVAPDGGNLHSQIRKGLAQLYEYRYVYQTPQARLCLVTNYGVTNKDKWLLDYLSKDRVIAYEWTDDFLNFQCESDSTSLLGSFSP
jgi:hypothetical protein